MVPPLRMRRGVYLLPNLVTTGGLFCGFYAIIATLREEYLVAAIAVLVAQVFDALDGRVARMTKTSSHFGVEYDSLSDLVAFGVAPGVLAYRWALEPWGVWGWLAASLYVICGALRLARFNVQVDVVDKQSFVGLPIPAAAAVVATTILMYYFLGGAGATNKHLTLLLLIYALAGLMISTIRYYSFKDLHLRHRQPFWILILGIIVIQLTIAEPHIMLFSIFSFYALSGPVRALARLWRAEKPRNTIPEEDAAPHHQPHTLDSNEESSL
ncbi:MAG: CDP-diacylglycerol--serine O-phosphatidyltransferase [Deltaproteobacteria bacterium]|nr:CDP-diacylglycerol--serine O-phosphatidyltransferase [Deltaproteobacteria bacterium]